MAEGDNVPQNPGASVTPPAPPPPAPTDNKQPSIEGKTPEEIIKLAQENGTLTSENKNLKDFYDKTAPVIETLLQDEEMLNKLNEAHAKRLGIKLPDKNEGKDAKETPADAKIDDTRKSIENSIVQEFNRNKGIDKMNPDQRKDFNQKMFGELSFLLNPKGDKSLDQILGEVSLQTLPAVLEKAYNLATLDEQKAKSAEKAVSEATMGMPGVMGSMPSGSSPDGEDITLSPAERQIAKEMGVAEDKFLQRKKEIAKRRDEGGF